MSEPLLTLEDVLQEARGLGLDLSERTFRYYSVMGLLPKPLKNPSGTTDARVHHYPPEIMQRLLDIRSLQSQGYSLKQIKDYFRVTVHVPKSSAAATPASAASTDVVADAENLLRALIGPEPTEAAKRFVAGATVDLTEDTLRRSVMQYYEELLSLFLGPEEAAAVLRRMISDMSPLEIETMLRPLRAMRNREWVRRTQRKELPLGKTLRELASQQLAGAVLSEPQQETLGHIARQLGEQQQRLSERTPLLPSIAARTCRWLSQALDRLLGACHAVQNAAAESWDDAQAATLLQEQVIQALADVEEAEKTIADAVKFMDSYRRLLTRELDRDNAAPNGKGTAPGRRGAGRRR